MVFVIGIFSLKRVVIVHRIMCIWFDHMMVPLPYWNSFRSKSTIVVIDNFMTSVNSKILLNSLRL